MIFRFTDDSASSHVLDMALEARFENGKVIQAMFIIVQRPTVLQRALVYREGITGKWLSSSGVSFNGLPKNPETLVRAVGGADPISEIYVFPAI